MLPEREQHELLCDRYESRETFPDVCVHELFEQQVGRSPEAVAIIFKKRQLTYRELNTRANQVAHHLQGSGIGPEALVGVCLERSPEMVIALLGVWKAGAAYVPLDPTYPQERLAFMISDADVRILLTDSKCRNLFSFSDCVAISLDTDCSVFARENVSNLPACQGRNETRPLGRRKTRPDECVGDGDWQGGWRLERRPAVRFADRV